MLEEELIEFIKWLRETNQLKIDVCKPLTEKQIVSNYLSKS